MDSDFIFIDLEWDQRGNKSSKKDPILEIGAVRMDKDSSFTRFIKNKDISRRTRKILNIKQNHINGGVDIDQAILELVLYSEGVNTVVVWSRDTKDKLSILSNKYPSLSLYKNIIVLQDLIQTLSSAKKNISFERALVAFGVKYDSMNMHNSYFDAMYLRDLFLKIINKYTEINPVLEDGVIIKKESEKYHLVDCSYIKNTAENEIVNVRYAINRKPCKRCSNRISQLIVNLDCKDVIKRNKKVCSYKDKPVTDEIMHEIADFFGFNISGGLSAATISTGYSFWRIYCDKDGYVKRVSHENYHSRECKCKGYHNHEAFPKDVFSLFRYIKRHDDAVNITPIAESLIKLQKKQEKKKKMQKERRRIERMCKLEEE